MVSETTAPSSEERPADWREIMHEFDKVAERLAAFGDRVAARARADFQAGGKDVHAEVMPANDVFQKWNLEILYVVGCNPGIRFNELQRTLDGISSRTLSNKLSELEERGYVSRTVASDRPPRVEYAATDDGRRLSRLAIPLVLFLARERRRNAARAEAPV